MKTQGRPQSDNVEDMRNYFGTEAFDPDYWTEDRFRDFLKQSIGNPAMQAPGQQFAPEGIFMGLPQQFIPGTPPPLAPRR